MYIKIVKKISGLLLCITLISCNGQISQFDKFSLPWQQEIRDYGAFVKSNKYASSYQVYENKELMKKANKKNTSIEINLKKQRLKLLVDGDVALDSPTTTGSKKKKDINDGKVVDKRTPKGTFEILEKKKHKQSTTYGKLYKGDKEVYYGDRRKYEGKYDRYEGVEMPYWMRVVDAIGIHESEAIVRNTGSNGCVRLPAQTAAKVYSKVEKGTEVKIE